MCQGAQRSRSIFTQILWCFCVCLPSVPSQCLWGLQRLVICSLPEASGCCCSSCPRTAVQSPLKPVRSSPVVLCALLQEILGKNLHFH